MKNSAGRVLVFDLDDTLIPSAQLYPLALQKVGIDERGPRYLAARSQVKAELPTLHVSARNRLLYFKRYLELEDRFSAGEVLRLMNDYEAALQELIAQFWTAERTEILKQLKSSFTLCLLTNENLRTQMSKVAAFDPHGELFDAIWTSEEVGFEKPNAEGFLRIEMFFNSANMLNTFTMIGDDWQNDMAPALSRGWQAIQTFEFAKDHPRSELTSESKCQRVEHLRDLLYILKA